MLRTSYHTCIGTTCMGTGVPEKNQPGRGNAKRRRRHSRGETRLIDTLISSNCGIIARRFLPICNPPRAIAAHLSTLFRTCKNIINERAGGARAIPPDCKDFILHASASVVKVYLATLLPLSRAKAFLFCARHNVFKRTRMKKERIREKSLLPFLEDDHKKMQ